MRKQLLMALSLVGLFISSYLWWVYTSPLHALVCLGTGCDTVRLSRYAEILGLPMPVLGVAMYAALALLLFAEQLIATEFARKVRYAFTAIAAAGFLFSLYLTGLEAFVIHAWCAWCVGSAVAVTFIFGITALELIRPARRPDAAAALATLRNLFTTMLVAIVIGIPAFIFLSRHGEVPDVVQASEHALRNNLIRADSHATGKLDSPVTVVEFADFECPACGRQDPVVREVMQKYGDRVRFIFRQYPLEQIHMNAMQAAEASECAGAQGKFWPAKDKLYDGQTDLTEPALYLYADQLGLDKARFSQCLSSHATLARIREDMADAHALGVDRTPTFFVGQQKIAQPMDLTQFSQLLDKELAARGGTKPGGATQTASSGSPFSTGGNIFASSQGSEMACSNDEALKAQPDLIRTPQTRQLFEGATKPLFVDVRAAKDYAVGHLPAAINIPVDDFERRFSELPKDRTIVLYESGKSPGDICGSSRAAGRVLLAHGFAKERVKVYQDGLADWQKAGLPVAH